ncbi:MAG: DUF2834 domain-containing protein [Candidatus Udaeobacter sp.]
MLSFRLSCSLCSSFAERAALGIRHLWLPIVATLAVGVSCGLPLFLYMRERVRDATKRI